MPTPRLSLRKDGYSHHVLLLHPRAFASGSLYTHTSATQKEEWLGALLSNNPSKQPAHTLTKEIPPRNYTISRRAYPIQSRTLSKLRRQYLLSPVSQRLAFVQKSLFISQESLNIFAPHSRKLPHSDPSQTAFYQLIVKLESNASFKELIQRFENLGPHN
ncbi:hypothetical protein PT974_03893 [Cladobotryum mycophilum]|uniref:Uncharacterized protein n=1 Tax=Cladobotryum mycophilum TaxID=491253 RepID=A0ABR0STK0_9HYPO